MPTSVRARRSAAAAAVLLLAAGATALTAAPASAFADPPVLTVTGDTAIEDLDGVYFGGECPAGTDNAVVSWPSGSSTSTIAPQTLDGTGAFSGAGSYYPVFPFVPGTTIVFTLDCRTGATVVSSSQTSFTFPTLGASVSLPTTAVVGDPISIPYSCGTPIGASTFAPADITIYDAPTDTLVATVSGLAVPSGTATLGTSASYGFTVGGTLRAYLNCNATTGGPVFRSGFRGGVVTTVVAAPPATTPTTTAPAAGGTGAALADTGVESVVAPLGAAILLLASGVLLVARRRARSV